MSEREHTNLRSHQRPRHGALSTSGVRGLTLLEMLIVIVIFSGIVAAVMTSLMVSRTSYASSDAYVQVQQEARRAFDNVVRDLHEAGRVNGNLSIPEPGAQRLDFQISRGYDSVTCGGICWGADDTTLPTGWIHYIFEASNPQNPRLMRCVTANRLDPMPANFAGCRVLANNVSVDPTTSAFAYDHANRMLTVRIEVLVTTAQLPGGRMGTTPIPLMTQVRLRNRSN